MNNPYPLRRNYGISPSAAAGLIAALIFFIAANIFVVNRTHFGASFYSCWLSGRVLFAQGGDPYGADLFKQTVAEYPNDPNVSGFVEPIYAMLLILPLTFIDNFKAALVIWMLLMEAALVYSGFKLKAALQIDGKTFSGVTLAFLLIGGYYAVIAVLDGDIGIAAVMIFLMALDAIRTHDDEYAGILLAFASIKYGLTFLPTIWICIYCLSHRRGTVAGWMLMTLILLILLGMLFKTDWILAFLRAVVYYYKYLNPSYFAELIANWQPELGGRIGWGISGVLAFIMILEWILNAHSGIRAFEWTTAMTITISFLLGIPNIGKNLYALWIGLAYALDKCVLRWPLVGKRLRTGLTIIFTGLPWLVSLLSKEHWSNPINSLNIFLPFIVLGFLYWNRWWNIDSFVEPY